MDYGYISDAIPEVTEDGEMRIILEFATSVDERQQIVFNFDEKVDFIKALTYWSMLLKVHEVVSTGIDNDSISIDDAHAAENRFSWSDDSNPAYANVSNPFFKMRHATE